MYRNQRREYLFVFALAYPNGRLSINVSEKKPVIRAIFASKSIFIYTSTFIPAAIFAASTVLYMSIAMVIGPAPPGTGVI